MPPGAPELDTSPPRLYHAFPDPIPGIVPFGAVTLFAGSPHAGKTIMLTDLATRLRDGRTFCGHKTNAQAVGLITTDHRWELDQGYWFAKAGWPDIPHVSLRNRDVGKLDWQLFRKSPAERHRVFRLAVQKLQLPPGGSLIVDIGQTFITDKINDYGEVMAGICGLGDITYEEYQLSLFATAHMGKQRSEQQYKKTHERIAGSVAFPGYSDLMMTLITPDDAGLPYYEFEIASRRMPEEKHAFVHDPTTGLFIPYKGAVSGETIVAVDQVDRPAELLRLIPEEGGISTSDLHDLGQAVFPKYSRATYYRDLDDLAERQQIDRSVFGWILKRKSS